MMRCEVCSPYGFGDKDNESIYCMNAYGEYLYAGTRNVKTGAQLHRTSDGTHWEVISKDGFGNENNVDFFGLDEYRGEFYVGTYNPDGGEIFRSPDGINFTKVFDKGGDQPSNVDFFNFIEFKGNLYAGTCNFIGCTRDIQQKYKPYKGGAIFRTSNGSDWVKVYQNSNINHNFIRDLVIFQGKMYAATGRHGSPWMLIRSEEGVSYEELTFEIVPDSYQDCPILLSHNDYLYCFLGQTRNKLPVKTYRFDGEKMVDLDIDGFGNKNNIAVLSGAVINGEMWVVARNYVEGMEILRSKNGVKWEKVLPNGVDGNNENESSLYSLVSFNGAIYVGVNNVKTGAFVIRITP